MRKLFTIAIGLFYQITAAYCEPRGHVDESEYSSDGPSSLTQIVNSWPFFGLSVVVLIIVCIVGYQRDKRKQKK